MPQATTKEEILKKRTVDKQILYRQGLSVFHKRPYIKIWKNEGCLGYDDESRYGVLDRLFPSSKRP